MDPFNKKKSTNKPNRQASNTYRKTMKVKNYPDIAHRNKDIHHITTTYSNMPGGATKKDSVSYKEGFDAGKVRLNEGYTDPKGYYGEKAVRSTMRSSWYKGDKYYRAGYKAGGSARAKHLQNKDTNRRKRN